jgi:hypothetical protein
MKRTTVPVMVVLPAVLLLACAAGAQQTPTTQPHTPPQQMPQTQPTPQTPAVPTTTQNIQCGNGGNCYDTNTTDRDTSGKNVRGQDFSLLAGSKGYVTQAEARKDPWLSSHFQQCDRNHDGKLTRTEYRKCQNASGGPT